MTRKFYHGNLLILYSLYFLRFCYEKMCEDLPFGEINRNLASKLCLKNNI